MTQKTSYKTSYKTSQSSDMYLVHSTPTGTKQDAQGRLYTILREYWSNGTVTTKRQYITTHTTKKVH